MDFSLVKHNSWKYRDVMVIITENRISEPSPKYS